MTSDDAQGPAPLRRGRPRDPRLRDQVLRAAANHLATTGFSAMTMEGLLSETGVAKRTLYRWWPSKSAVVAEAILEGFVVVPGNRVMLTADVWADLDEWLKRVAVSVQGAYGEVLRAAVAIGAADPVLGNALSSAFATPARSHLLVRLRDAVDRGQIAADADIDGVIDILMAIIVFVGTLGEDVHRIPAVLQVIRLGVEPRPGGI